MMLSASYSLVTEGIAVEEEFDVEGWLSAGMRVAAGVLAGLMFILSTKKVRVHQCGGFQWLTFDVTWLDYVRVRMMLHILCVCARVT